MANVIKPPSYVYTSDNISIFLAGSIEMGSAIDWQKDVEKYLKKYPDLDLYNPRRDNWDSSWEQDISNPKFVEQVTWELDHIEKADIVLFHFDPNTKSPITLYELGSIRNQICIVSCPKGFWRRGNVQIICERYGYDFYNSLDEMLKDIPNKLADAKRIRYIESNDAVSYGIS